MGDMADYLTEQGMDNLEDEFETRPEKKRFVICTYCGKRAKLVTGKEIYPHRPDLFDKKMWLCKPCGAWVGVHQGTDKPLGILANGEIRAAKIQAHKAFDAIWKSGELKRQDAYKWLQGAMGLRAEDCHIGMFGIDLCKLVVKVCQERTK
jgi:hypothetical protein